MTRILLAALIGLVVFVVPAIAAGDSNKSPSSDARIVLQTEPNAELASQPGKVQAEQAGVKDSTTTTAAKDDEPRGATNDDFQNKDVEDVQANLNDSQKDLDDVDDGPVNDVDDVEEGEINDVDDDDDVDDHDDGNVED